MKKILHELNIRSEIVEGISKFEVTWIENMQYKKKGGEIKEKWSGSATGL